MGYLAHWPNPCWKRGEPEVAGAGAVAPVHWHGDVQSRFCRLVRRAQLEAASANALGRPRHLKSERAKLDFGAWSFPRHSGRALVSFAYLPEVLDELRMSFRILDVEVDAQHSQPCGKHLRGI